MITSDYIAIGLLVCTILVGASMGFGKGLKLITNGLFGTIISIVVCYFFLGIFLNFQFVQSLMAKLNSVLVEQNNVICNFLIKINIEKIIVAVLLFIIVQIIRKLIFSIICSFMESDVMILKLLNKIGGIVLFCALISIIVLIIFQIANWVSGSDGAIYNFVKGSKLYLEYIYQNNPLNSIFESIKQSAGL